MTACTMREEDLHLFFDGDAPTMEEHVSACPRCTDRLETLTRQHDALPGRASGLGFRRSRLDRLGCVWLFQCRTRLPFHRKALRHSEFVSGRYTTNFVATVMETGKRD